MIGNHVLYWYNILIGIWSSIYWRLVYCSSIDWISWCSNKLKQYTKHGRKTTQHQLHVWLNSWPTLNGRRGLLVSVSCFCLTYLASQTRRLFHGGWHHQPERFFHGMWFILHHPIFRTINMYLTMTFTMVILSGLWYTTWLSWLYMIFIDTPNCYGDNIPLIHHFAWVPLHIDYLISLNPPLCEENLDIMGRPPCFRWLG